MAAILHALLLGMTAPVIRRCPDGHFHKVIYDLVAFIALVVRMKTMRTMGLLRATMSSPMSSWPSLVVREPIILHRNLILI